MAAPCGTAVSMSPTSWAACLSAMSGGCWSMESSNPGIPPAEPFPIPIHSGDVRVDVQSAIAMLAPAWGLQPILDIDDDTARENLAHVSVMALSLRRAICAGVWDSRWSRKPTSIKRTPSSSDS